MTDLPRKPSPLLDLASELEATSPGFTRRVREFADTVSSTLPDEQFDALGAALARVIRMEGVARDAGLAVLTLPGATLGRFAPVFWEAWGEASCRVGEVSVRAGQAFGAAAVTSLAAAIDTEGAPRDHEAAERLARLGSALRDFVARHPAEPIVNRCASMLGEAVPFHPADVGIAWLSYAEAVAFVPRRPLDVLRALPEETPLASGDFARVVSVVAACAGWDVREAPQWFEEAPRLLAGVPESSREGLLDVLAQLGGDAISVMDLLRGVGPVLRRLPPATRQVVLDLDLEIARQVPTAAPRFVRSVLRIGEAVGFESDLEAFVAEGLSLGEMHASAAEAFFALESRGARAFLSRHDSAVRFEDVETTLRGYLRILERRAPHLVGVEYGGLFPHLETRNVIPVSARIGTFPTWDENFTLLKLQATLATLWSEAGTRGFRLENWLPEPEDGEEKAEGAFLELYARFELPEAAAGILAHVEAARLAPLIAEQFPGLASDLAELRAHAWSGDRVAADEGEPAALLFLALGGAIENIEFSEGRDGLVAFAQKVHAGEATVYDSVDETARMSRLLEDGELVRVQSIEDLFLEDPTMSYLLDDSEEDGPVPFSESEEEIDKLDFSTDGEGERSDETSESVGVDPELLKAFLEQNPKVKVMKADGPLDATGLFVAGLTGGGGDAERGAPRGAPEQVFALSRGGREAKGIFLYDEWDHEIADYRNGWCRVHEIGLEEDDPGFFSDTLARFQDVLPEVRRQFQKVKPEGYRTIRGLLDGEDFDFDAVVLSRTDLRARLNPSTRLYTQRQREERDVATLFLLDMSASTDEEVEKPEAPEEAAEVEDLSSLFAADPEPRPRGRRVIDIQKEALVIMAQALEEIGDLFSILGFSGHGRDRVELFDAKTFDESLSLAVKSRLSAIEPQRSTRMGPAIRHAIRKLGSVSSRSKHLILLSDGFPQDFDYGRDRRSNLYGLRDTAQALREAEQEGISTFCITVDRAGHDYLREMCDDSRYLVIDEIDSLPLELPKIYSRATRGG